MLPGLPFVLSFSYSGADIHLDYSIQSNSGHSVNILVMSAANYGDYVANGSSNYVVEASRLNTTNGVFVGTLPPGTYYLLVALADPIGIPT